MFSYEEAFSRNLGWITEREREILRHKKVAIAGMGGVGGAHVLTLARLGISHFHISDMDHFELANFNRQAGAFMSSLGKSKVEIMRDMIHDINPEATVTLFDQGIHDHDNFNGNADNINEFLDGVDLFIDGFDFFVIDIRRIVFEKCRELDIPAITAAPVGMGVALLSFMPGEMSFEDYFGLVKKPKEMKVDSPEDKARHDDNMIRFLIGLTPNPLHKDYLVDPSRVDMKNKKVPSTPIGIQLSSGFLVAQVLKILLAREGIKAAPHYFLFDAYHARMKKGYVFWGYKNPLQKLKFLLGKKLYANLSKKHALLVQEEEKAETISEKTSVMEKILNISRWAPSGDNVQPWRFTIKTEKSLTIHVPAIEAENPYEFNHGQPTYLSVGMLLETMRMAAAKFSLSMHWRVDKECIWDGRAQDISVIFRARKTAVADELLRFVTLRSVLRFPFRTRKLSAQNKEMLQNELESDFEIIWFENTSQRLAFSRLNAIASDIRLRLEACFKVHQHVIDWGQGDSKTGIPSTAVGMDRMSLKLMKWAMQKWSRMDFMNKYMAGTVLARLQLDLVPGYASAAHFIILRKKNEENKEARTLEEVLKSGASLQRFWLRASEQGLVLQPSMATVCFSHYASQKVDFAKGQENLTAKAEKLAQGLNALCDNRADDIIFSGRIGYPKSGRLGDRSLRKDISELTAP